MGFHEDDRIRRKNAVKSSGIIEDRVNLLLDNVLVSEVVDLLANSGLSVRLEQDNTISVQRKPLCGKDSKRAVKSSTHDKPDYITNSDR